MKEVTPSDHQVTLMAYLLIYGINKTTRSMVVDNMKMYLNYETYGRAINKLNEYGFLVKGEDRAQYYLAPDIKIPDQEEIGLILYFKKPRINNTNGIPAGRQ
jgi:hypothetical protein